MGCTQWKLVVVVEGGKGAVPNAEPLLYGGAGVVGGVAVPFRLWS